MGLVAADLRPRRPERERLRRERALLRDRPRAARDPEALRGRRGRLLRHLQRRPRSPADARAAPLLPRARPRAGRRVPRRRGAGGLPLERRAGLPRLRARLLRRLPARPGRQQRRGALPRRRQPRARDGGRAALRRTYVCVAEPPGTWAAWTRTRNALPRRTRTTG